MAQFLSSSFLYLPRKKRWADESHIKQQHPVARIFIGGGKKNTWHLSLTYVTHLSPSIGDVDIRRVGTSSECRYISRVVHHEHFSVYWKEGEKSPRVRASLKSSALHDFTVKGPSRSQKEHTRAQRFLAGCSRTSSTAIDSRSSRSPIDTISFVAPLRSNGAILNTPTLGFRHGSGNQGE